MQRLGKVLLELAVVALLATAACNRAPGADVVAPSPAPHRPPVGDGADLATPSAPLGSAPESVDPEEQAVLDAYQGYWDALLAANDPPDEFHPALRRYATGEAFDSLFNGTQTNRLASRALRLPADSIYEHRAEVISVDADTATVRDCAIDDGIVVDLETGALVQGGAPVTRLSTGTLVREDGAWKVSFTKVEQTWEGVGGCALG